MIVAFQEIEDKGGDLLLIYRQINILGYKANCIEGITGNIAHLGTLYMKELM